MSLTSLTDSAPAQSRREHVDVLIVGAGISGIGAARHLQARFPQRSFAILEARQDIGGTWDLFRYPGIRSDSDMQTLGYRSKPWTGEKSIADGPSILGYLNEAARETGITEHIHFGHRVLGAAWSSPDARWTVRAEITGGPRDGQEATFTCSFLFCASGYYRYDEGYTPHFDGTERFQGQIVHPQLWPEDLDYAGRRVVVIGSGATAVTLVPAMTDRAEHVTMLQRSPTYIGSLPSVDPIDRRLRQLLGDRRAYPIARWKNILFQAGQYQLARRRPEAFKAVLRRGLLRHLPAGYDIDTHFKPNYDPWDQRVCAVPDGDLFRALRDGQASVVTDRIRTFTERGLALESGRELEADIVVTATGLNLLIFGGIEFTVDGAPVHLPESLAYRGMMLSDVPNFAFAIGYTNASWTLKVDLVCEYLNRLLSHMDRHGYTTAVPVNADPTMETRPLLDFQAGYVLRALGAFPRQGTKGPWQLTMNYLKDMADTRRRDVADGVMRFSTAPASASASASLAQATASPAESRLTSAA